MTRMHTGPRPPISTSPGAARRVPLGAIGLVVLTALVLAGTGLLPLDAGSAAPPRTDRSTVPLDPDDPRLRDDHVDPFDDAHPAVAGLRPQLRAALQRAARDAQAGGIDLWVTSGWRSAAYQQELLDQAVQRYGSLGEALRFVATPDDSAHVTGDAVDVGPTGAAAWLIRHGAAYGLCQTYANELWHFELATEPGGTCPTPRPDAAS